MLWLSLWWWLALAAGPVQTPSLGHIKDKQLADLAELPNYTCTETVDRFRRSSPARRFEQVDRVRLEIAVVGARELFGWPGSQKIIEEDVTHMVDGFISSGDFAMHVRELFAGPRTEFVAVGEELREGRHALRYDYRVPLKASGWRLRATAGAPLPVAYHGSFWVDRDSLDLVELNVTADDVPRSLGSTALSKILKYRRARIGSSDFLLPVQASMLTADLDGEESLNETRFHDCRQYTVETVLHFDPPAAIEQNGPQAAPAGPLILPNDFDVTATLETAIDSDTAAVGDPIRARVEQAIKTHGATVVPKHALLAGRIAEIAVVENRRYLDLMLTYFDIDGTRIDVGGRRNELHLEVRKTPSNQVGFDTHAFNKVPFPIRGDGVHLRLSRGSVLFLRSHVR